MKDCNFSTTTFITVQKNPFTIPRDWRHYYLKDRVGGPPSLDLDYGLRLKTAFRKDKNYDDHVIVENDWKQHSK